MTRTQRLAILWRRQGRKCGICKAEVPPSQVWMLTFDHIVPKSHGGGDGMRNLQAAHYSCNARKGNACPGCRKYGCR